MQNIIKFVVLSRQEALRRMDEIKCTQVDAQADYKQLIVVTTNAVYQFEIDK